MPDASIATDAQANAQARVQSDTGADAVMATRDRATSRVTSETDAAESSARAAVDVQAHAEAQAAPVTQVGEDAQAQVRAQTKPVDDAQARVDAGRAQAEGKKAEVEGHVAFAEEARARPAATGEAVVADSFEATRGVRDAQGATDRARDLAVDRATSAADIQGSVDAEIEVNDPTALGDKLKPT